MSRRKKKKGPYRGELLRLKHGKRIFALTPKFESRLKRYKSLQQREDELALAKEKSKRINCPMSGT